MIEFSTNVRFYYFGGFCLDVINRELLKNGEHIALTQKSFEILQFLIENRSRMLKKEEILKAIWLENFVEEANLAQHIYMIRKVLKDNGDNESYIETVPKYGYRFISEVAENTDPNRSSHQEFLASSVTQTDSNGNGSRQNGHNSLPPEPINVEQTPSPQTTSPRSLVIPNLVFATIFTLIISAFIYLAYFNNYSGMSDSSKIESISILPFKQIGGGVDEKLELGLADTLISRLSNQDKITISPTATIENISNNDGSINSIELGEKLNVDAVLAGTIQRENEFVRVNVQLISVQTKVPIWSDKFDVKFSDVFSLQDKISEKLAKKLSIKLDDSVQFALKSDDAPNAEAEAEFKKGLELWNKRTIENLPKVIEHFENAVSKDENFAKAYAHLADSYSLIGYYKITEVMPPGEAITRAETLANKALELNSDLSEAYTALALVAVCNKQLTKAQKLYKNAIRLNPDNATAHQRLAWILTTEDSLNDAIDEMRLAQKANPQSHTINMSLASLLRLNRQTDEALNYAQKAIKIAPSKAWAKMVLAEIYEQKGQLDKSIKELRTVQKDSPEEKTAKLLLSRVYAKKGNKEEARKILKDADNSKNKEPLPTYEVATVYAHLGEKKEAVKKLQKSKDDSLMYFLHLKYDYNIDPLRDTPEYSELLSKSKNKLSKSQDKNS